MRWVAILLLIGNVLYLGWELDRETKALVANSRPVFAVPVSTTTLKRINDSTPMLELRGLAERYQPRQQVLLPAQR